MTEKDYRLNIIMTEKDYRLNTTEKDYRLNTGVKAVHLAFAKYIMIVLHKPIFYETVIYWIV